MSPRFLVGVVALSALAAVSAVGLVSPAQERPGYDDTPVIPGQPFKVHDKDRPHPAVVTPGATTGAPPSDAVVLFDGTDLEAWTGNGGQARWNLVDGAMEVNGTGAIRTREQFADCQLHLEWATPADVEGDSQGRGNSGVFLMGRYELQVLDSYQNPSYPDGQAGAMYGQWPPLRNACRAPGEWQTYDILFQAPRFEGETLLSPARVTLIHNGVVVHHAQEFLGSTTHRAVARYAPHGPTGPLELQDHGNPIRFRNIWIRPLGAYDQGE